MKKVKNKLEKRLLLNLYYMLIYPYLTYCNTISGRAPNVYLDKTYILQKTIVRIIRHVGFFDHTEPLFSTLQIMNIYQINKYMCCILMFKHNKAMLPTLFNDVFVLSPMTHKYCTIIFGLYRTKNMEHLYLRQLSTTFCHFTDL